MWWAWLCRESSSRLSQYVFNWIDFSRIFNTWISTKSEKEKLVPTYISIWSRFKGKSTKNSLKSLATQSKLFRDRNVSIHDNCITLRFLPRLHDSIGHSFALQSLINDQNLFSKKSIITFHDLCHSCCSIYSS